MPKPLRIAVLSDQHISSSVDEDSWDLAKAAYKAAANAKVDHVVLAGDTFDCATAMLEDRDRVERYVRRLGLWHRDRMTIVVGNHDIFHTPHSGTAAERFAEVARVLTVAANDNYDAFTEWAGQLARPRDRLAGSADLYPIEKKLGHVKLWAVDTTAAATVLGGNGYWREEDDAILRDAADAAAERRVLVVHNAPFKSPETRIKDLLTGEFPFGYPSPEFRRLRRFAEDAQVDAIVAGHIHQTDSYSWTLGTRWRCKVRVVGRTGAVHDTTPMFGILNVPERGALRWEEVRI